MNSDTKNYPFEIKKLDPEEHTEVFKLFDGDGGILEDFIRVGPKDYWLPNGFEELAGKIYNMKLRPDDIWVVTYPKSGTTLMQELLWLVANDFDYTKAEAIPLPQRFPFLEISMCFNGEKAQTASQHDERSRGILEGMNKMFERAVSMQSPRFIKSHLPMSLLPPALLDTCRVLHIARDPRDVAVSFYHHYLFLKYLGYTGNFKEFWKLFIEDKIIYSPYFENVKESWRMRNHPNMLFLFYEEVLKDLPSAVKRVAAFLGKTVTEEQVSRLCEHLAFDNFKKNKSVNLENLRNTFAAGKGSFIRKGVAGGWREYFDEEMIQQAQRWMENNLRDTDLRFPILTENLAHKAQY